MMVSIDNKGVYVQLAMSPEAKDADNLHADRRIFCTRFFFLQDCQYFETENACMKFLAKAKGSRERLRFVECKVDEQYRLRAFEKHELVLKM